MNIQFKNILIISDIEGSSGCWDYNASSFKTMDWAKACVDMSLDVNAVVKSLFANGVEKITVKDFHRTAFNLLTELVDSRAKIVSGYKTGPVPGIGDPGNATGLIMLGMHAAAGSNGFIPHSLSYRKIKKIEIDNSLVTEGQLFSSSLSSYGIKPIFFSGCQIACEQAENAIMNINTFPIDKSGIHEKFDKIKWRKELAQKAVESLNNISTEPYNPEGPFNASVTMKTGKDAAKQIAERWKLKYKKDQVFIYADDFQSLYKNLINIAYFTPFLIKILPFTLFLFNIWGRLGLRWVRKKIKTKL